jgi:hypothetical protein
MIGKEDWSGGPERCAGGRALPPWFRGMLVKTATSFALAALGVALFTACSRASKPTAPGWSEKSGPGWTDDGGTDSAAPAASVPSKPPPRFRAEEGCARDFRASGEPSRDLGELERLCAPGLAPVLSATENTRASGFEGVEVPFRVTSSTSCLRAGALGVAPGQVLSIENTRGGVLAAALASDTIAVVPVDGTVCVREAGTYRFVVKPGAASSEARTLTVQVWQASRD